jgi:5-methylcytosine-specific restriction endonuclease McrA
VNKTQVKKLLVAERKSMREKQKKSAFMRKTNSIYRGMKKRASEAKQTLNYSLDELRGAIEKQLGLVCGYCECTIVTVANMAVDHVIPIARGGSHSKTNLWLCCRPCNWQKGQLTKEEFLRLIKVVRGMQSDAAADIKRRLTIGGKWGVRVG